MITWLLESGQIETERHQHKPLEAIAKIMMPQGERLAPFLTTNLLFHSCCIVL